eukprot:m.688056 g.688056  ORF g.688056 m.688056 type:complete len:233 (+) comp22845_c0_seq21:1460-2158(+)
MLALATHMTSVGCWGQRGGRGERVGVSVGQVVAQATCPHKYQHEPLEAVLKQHLGHDIVLRSEQPKVAVVAVEWYCWLQHVLFLLSSSDAYTGRLIFTWSLNTRRLIMMRMTFEKPLWLCESSSIVLNMAVYCTMDSNETLRNEWRPVLFFVLLAVQECDSAPVGPPAELRAALRTRMYRDSHACMLVSVSLRHATLSTGSRCHDLSPSAPPVSNNAMPRTSTPLFLPTLPC